MNRIKVLLAGGRKITREALSELLASQPALEVVGEVEALAAVGKVAAATGVEIVIYLNAAFSASFVKQVTELRRERPEVRMVALLIDLRGIELRHAFEVGVAACLGKECSSADLLVAIRAAHVGGTYLSPSATGAVVTREGSSAPLEEPRAGHVARLSNREVQVIRRVADGESTKEIARRLGVSTKTVETHRQRAMTKLGIYTVAGLTKFAVREGITSLDNPCET